MAMTVRPAAEARILRLVQRLPASIDAADLVFMGGTVLPLLVDVDRRFESPRPTKDVDGIMASATYSTMGAVEQALRDAGFKHMGSDPEAAPGTPISRWTTPDTEIFDLTFYGQHIGATGARVDELAIETATTMVGHPPLRHLSSVGFFMTKAQAFRDRHQRTSKDLADLGVLLACDPDIKRAVATCSSDVQEMVRTQAQALRAFPLLKDRMRGTFSGRGPIVPDTPQSVTEDAMRILDTLTE